MPHILTKSDGGKRCLSLEIDVRIFSPDNLLDLKMEEIKSVPLPFEWVFPEGLQPQFSDNSVIQFLPPNENADHFVLSFFRMKQAPMLTKEMDAATKKEKLEKLGKIETVCVAQVILTPEQVRKLISSLTDNLKNFEDTIRERK